MRRPLVATLILGGLLASGCVAPLTDEVAVTVAKTREATVRSSERLADAAERLPGTLDALKGVLESSGRVADDSREAARLLTLGAAGVASQTAASIERLGSLAVAFERVATTTDRIFEDARRDAEETREERHRILGGIAQATSSLQSLLGRAEDASRTWAETARSLGAEEKRAARALADLSEASARTTDGVAHVASDIAFLSHETAPELVRTTKSLASIAEDMARITHRLAEGTSGGAWAGDVLVGAVAGLAAFGLAAAVRLQFRRAVERAVAARGGPRDA